VIELEMASYLAGIRYQNKRSLKLKIRVKLYCLYYFEIIFLEEFSTYEFEQFCRHEFFKLFANSSRKSI